MAPACERAHYSKGYCSKHYQRMRNHGSLEEPSVRRFWALVDKTPSHWLWTGTLSDAGYGRYNNQQAHRVAWTLTHGPIPDDLPLDHVCRVTACVRPEQDHLEPVTDKVNSERGYCANINAARQLAITHCPRGHEYTPENTRVDSAGHRNCRACGWLRRHDPAAYHATKYGLPVRIPADAVVRIDVGRSVGAAVRAEISLAGRDGAA